MQFLRLVGIGDRPLQTSYVRPNALRFDRSDLASGMGTVRSCCFGATAIYKS